MTLSDLASIGSFVSGLAVLMSLVYLGLQVRPNTHAHIATAHQARQNTAKEHLDKLIDGPTASIYLRGARGDASMTDLEVLQFLALMNRWYLGLSENAWLSERGVLDNEAFATTKGAMISQLRYPGIRVAWALNKPMMPAKFAVLVDETLAQLADVPAPKIADIWKAALARQMPPGPNGANIMSLSDLASIGSLVSGVAIDVFAIQQGSRP